MFFYALSHLSLGPCVPCYACRPQQYFSRHFITSCVSVCCCCNAACYQGQNLTKHLFHSTSVSPKICLDHIYVNVGRLIFIICDQTRGAPLSRADRSPQVILRQTNFMFWLEINCYKYPLEKMFSFIIMWLYILCHIDNKFDCILLLAAGQTHSSWPFFVVLYQCPLEKTHKYSLWTLPVSFVWTSPSFIVCLVAKLHYGCVEAVIGREICLMPWLFWTSSCMQVKPLGIKSIKGTRTQCPSLGRCTLDMVVWPPHQDLIDRFHTPNKQALIYFRQNQTGKLKKQDRCDKPSRPLTEEEEEEEGTDSWMEQEEICLINKLEEA